MSKLRQKRTASAVKPPVDMELKGAPTRFPSILQRIRCPARSREEDTATVAEIEMS